MKEVGIPIYNFKLHQREREKQYMGGFRVIIVEGLFVLHDYKLRQLLDLKIFVQADADILLARRILRDTRQRGRDISGILQQYLTFVKPSMDNIITPSSKFADFIIPGEKNNVAVDMVAFQILDRLHYDELKEAGCTNTKSGTVKNNRTINTVTI